MKKNLMRFFYPFIASPQRLHADLSDRSISSKQIIGKSIATQVFVAEPEDNDVTERCYRSLKEQVTYGRPYHMIEELCTVITDSINRCHKYRLLEKLGFKSPRQAFDEFQIKAVA